MEQIPHLSTHFQGVLLFLFGLVLFLNVTNILVIGTKAILILASLGLMALGFMKMDGHRKIRRMLKK